jgi:quinol monooxygenase YgiN
MSKVCVIAKITANEGMRSDMVTAMGSMIDHVEANEPDTITYILLEDAGDENVVWFYEEYTDEDALAAHGSSEAMKQLGGALRGFASGRPEITVLNPIRGKGL